MSTEISEAKIIISPQPNKNKETIKLQNQFSQQQKWQFLITYNLLKSQQNIFNDRIRDLEIFLSIASILNIYLACADKSPGMTSALTPTIPLTFRAWNIIDAIANLLALILFIIVRIIVIKRRIVNFYHFSTGNFKLTMLICFLLGFKFSWIVYGVVFARNFFTTGSDILMQFITVYFIGAVGGIVYFIHYQLRNKILSINEKKFLNKYKKQLVDFIKQIQQNLQNQQDKTRYNYKKSLAQNKMKLEQMGWFFWVVTIVLFWKDNSPCLLSTAIGPLTYRLWLLLQFIILLAWFFLNLVYQYVVNMQIFKTHKQENHSKWCSVFYVTVYILIFWVGQVIFNYLGLYLFLNLPQDSSCGAEEVCSPMVRDFSIVYFLSFIIIQMHTLLYYIQDRLYFCL